MSVNQIGGIIGYRIASAGNNNNKSTVITAHSPETHTRTHPTQANQGYIFNSSYLPFIHKNKFFSRAPLECAQFSVEQLRLKSFD